MPFTFSHPKTGKKEIFWVKKAVTPKNTKWHEYQAKIARRIPLGMLRPTVCQGDSDRLKAEKMRIDAFHQNGIKAPEVALITNDVLIIRNLGDNLNQRISSLKDQNKRFLLIKKAASALATVHKIGLYHGRAHIKDLVIDKNEIGFLDFEESPLCVMSLPEAQARDIWLFTLSVAKLLNKDNLRKIGDILIKDVSIETKKELKTFIYFLRPLRRFVSFIGAPGSDTKKAVKTNKVFEKIFAKLKI